MSFLCRISKSRFNQLFHQFKSVPNSSLLNSTLSHAEACVTDNAFGIIHNKVTGFSNNVRFFAVPVQFQTKPKEEKESKGPRLNEKIQAERVRLVIDEEHAVVSRREALERAKKLGLDLVEVNGKVDPPVCKIMDFHKEKYQRKLRVKERAKSKVEATLKSVSKEVKFSVKTEARDLQTKADMVKRLMDQGYRVKCTAKGTADQDLQGMLSRLSALIEDLAIIESGPSMAKDGLYIMVRHMKYGNLKKGGGKKSKAAGDANIGAQNITSKPAGDSDELNNPAESGLESEDDNLYHDEVEQTVSPSMTVPGAGIINKKTAWSVSDGNVDFDKVFSLSENTNRVTEKTIITGAELASIIDSSVSDVHRTKQVFGPKGTPTVPSPSALSGSAENRYKKSEARNPFPQTKGMDVKGLGSIDSIKPESQFLNRGRQPQLDVKFSPPLRESKPAAPNTSFLRNLNPPSNDRTTQESSSTGAPSAQGSSFGIFSAPKANDPGKQGGVLEVNQNKEQSRYSTINPPTRGAAANPNLSGPKFDSSQTNTNKGRDGRWGIFNGDGSNMSLNNRLAKQH